MKHILGHNLENLLNTQTALTLGNFDGLHIGHRKLITLIKDYSQKFNLTSVIFSFNPHPVLILANDKNFKMITSPQERLFLLEDMGIDLFIEYPFDKEFSQMEPEHFVVEILFKKLKTKVIVIGEENSFGKEHRGSYEILKKLGDKHGVLVIAMPHEKDNGKKISSSEIRKLVYNKDFALIEKHLSVPFFIMGKVMHGKKLGRTLGFPTVNLVPNRNKILPPNGVYLTKTYVDDNIYYSITNIGNNPTFEGKIITIETYLFDFDQDIYDKEIRIEFYGFLREETKFTSIDELKKRVHEDIKIAKEYFKI